MNLLGEITCGVMVVVGLCGVNREACMATVSVWLTVWIFIPETLLCGRTSPFGLTCFRYGSEARQTACILQLSSTQRWTTNLRVQWKRKGKWITWHRLPAPLSPGVWRISLLDKCAQRKVRSPARQTLVGGSLT